jgi:large subunit ribosomal protein L22|tara:strand:+ start:3252 stop:3632 length:381 start_codon:yes stop_codon:yes gene_type:complete
MGKKPRVRSLEKNEAMARTRNLRISPRKLNLVAESIRGLRAEQAIAALEFSTRRISGEVKKCLQSAIANAENNHELDVDQLVVSEASVGKGVVMKRFRPRARGRAGRIKKPFAHIKIVVSERHEEA